MSDTYSNNTLLLLHMNGGNNSTVFTDNGQFKLPVTANGDAKISTAESKYGGSSGYFDGSGDYLSTLPIGTIGTNDFTIECWVRLANSSATQFLVGSNNNTNGYFMLAFNNTAGHVDVGRSGVVWEFAFSGFSVANNTWFHFALARQGSSNYCFINGTAIGTTVTNATSWTFGANSFWIGHQHQGNALSGYLQDFRVTVGHARYTANFTPPTELLPDPDENPSLCITPEPSNEIDLAFGGQYHIAGTVSELNVPGPYRVRLYDRYSGLLVRETFSAEDGAYAFGDIAYKDQGYFAIAYDHGDDPLNAAIADLITPIAI